MQKQRNLCPLKFCTYTVLIPHMSNAYNVINKVERLSSIIYLVLEIYQRQSFKTCMGVITFNHVETKLSMYFGLLQYSS